MVEPLLADLFTRAVPHGFFHIVSGLVGVQRIQPYKHHVLVLGFELGLTIDRPREVPVLRAVLDSDDTASCDLSGARITLANVDDMLNDFFV